MNAREAIQKGLVVLVFEYPDGSQIKCLTTKNKEMLEMFGMKTDGTIYDMEVYKEVPPKVLPFMKRVEVTDKITYESELDLLVSKGVKLCW